ncbi:MAG: hypothetical protein IJY40_05535, partial [Oscillospiraceae bacterium]|nr:hypothetical protein [Oscillospiraceae bacterium]
MLYRLFRFRPHSSPDPLTRATLPPGQCHQLKHPTFKGVLYFGKIWLFYAALFVGQPYPGALGQRH